MEAQTDEKQGNRFWGTSCCFIKTFSGWYKAPIV